MSEIKVTLKESDSTPGTIPETRIVISDRRGSMLPEGHTITGTVIHLSEETYRYNSALKIIKIKTDIGIDFQILSYDTLSQTVTEEEE